MRSKTGGRQLTMSPEDAALRREWMATYLAVGGETETDNWDEETPEECVQNCPEQANEDKPDETYEWYFSA